MFHNRQPRHERWEHSSTAGVGERVNRKPSCHTLAFIEAGACARCGWLSWHTHTHMDSVAAGGDVVNTCCRCVLSAISLGLAAMLMQDDCPD